MAEHFNLKLMTYNIGGGRRDRKDSELHFSEILEIIGKTAPDILGVQEAVTWSTLDGEKFSQSQKIVQEELNHYNCFFGPTLTMSQNFHVKKDIFVHALFNDWTDWQQGNALFSRWPFVRLGDGSKPGQPKNVPINQTIYSGNRDTDPRYAILARIDLGFTKIFTLVTHLTTLYGERVPEEIQGKQEEAQAVRWEQCARILDLIQTFILEKNELLIIMGDLNAIPGEPAILSLLEKRGGLVRLVPNNNIGTHPRMPEPIDHILIYPGKYHVKYSCEVINNKFIASDHNPVVAEISLHSSDSKAFKAYGAGVFREDPQ